MCKGGRVEVKAEVNYGLGICVGLLGSLSSQATSQGLKASH